jgi:stage V sporulation protein G
MKVTEVRVSPSKGGGKIRAFASIVIDDCFIVNDVRVVEGREGQLFVTMPARKTRNGQMRDIAHPLNSDTREAIEQRVLSEFDQAVKNRVIPDQQRNSARKRDKQSPMDRLASRLFSEEFWVVEPGQGDNEKD